MVPLLKLLRVHNVFFMFLIFFAVQSIAQEREFLSFSESDMQDTLLMEPELLLRVRREASPSDSSTSSSPESTDEPETATMANETEFTKGSATSEGMIPDTVETETTPTQTPTSTPTTPPPTTTTPRVTTTTPHPTTAVFNTTTIRDNHQYYVSHVYNEASITTPYLELFKTKFIGVKPSHDFLRKAIGRAKSFKSSFDFLFYGHSIRDIAITTGGFLYMSNFLHRLIMHSQYIAPLMGHFRTTENGSDIYHVDDGSAFWVEWRNLYLYGKESAGPFSFYTVIHQNGTIVFAYEKLPIGPSIDWPVSKFSNSFTTPQLPIAPKNINGTRKIGLSDAFYVDSTFPFGIQIRRIYRYHTVAIDPANIRAGTVVVMDPLLTCHELKTCSDCLSGRSTFTCSWCPAAGRCSSGIDRLRQDWIQKSCHLEHRASCPILPAIKSVVTTAPVKDETTSPSTAKGQTTATPKTTTTTTTTPTTTTTTPTTTTTTTPTTTTTTPKTTTTTTPTTMKTITLPLSETQNKETISTLTPKSTTTEVPKSKSGPQSRKRQGYSTYSEEPRSKKRPCPVSGTAKDCNISTRKSTSTRPTVGMTGGSTTPSATATVISDIFASRESSTETPQPLTEATESGTSSPMRTRSTISVGEITALLTSGGGSTRTSRITSTTASSTVSGNTGVSSRIIFDGVTTPTPGNIGRRRGQPKGLSSPVIVGIVFIVIIVVATIAGMVMWCRYAYTHPTSPSGIWLMEHRPSVIKEKMTSMFGSENPGQRYQVSFNTQESVA